MRKRRKLMFSMLAEILETICTLCLIEEKRARREHIEEGYIMRSHFVELKKYSEILRSKIK